MTAQLKRDLGLFSCTMLVIGNIIGVGDFSPPLAHGTIIRRRFHDRNRSSSDSRCRASV